MCNIARFQNCSERHSFLEDELPRFRRKQYQTYLIRSKLNRLVRSIQYQGDLAKVIFSPLFPVQDSQMNAAAMKLLECGGHVIMVDEQAPIRLRHFLWRNLFNLRQRQSCARVQCIKRIDVRNGDWWCGCLRTIRHNGHFYVAAGKIPGAGGPPEEGLRG